MRNKDEAKVLGIGPSYWSAIKKGKKIPSLKLAERIEKTFPQHKVVDLIPSIKKIVKRSIRV